MVATRPSGEVHYSARGVTLEILAAVKGLPVGHLRTAGWWTTRDRVTSHPAVAIPWIGHFEDGAEGRAVHLRRRLELGGDGPRWLWDLPRGLDLLPYGAGSLADWRADAEAIVQAGCTVMVAAAREQGGDGDRDG